MHPAPSVRPGLHGSLPRILIVAGSLGLLMAEVALGAPRHRRLPDGKLWTAKNLDVPVQPSYCYDGVDRNCRRYGRLYTWESAQRACATLGAGWRLPADEDWRLLARRFGGVSGEPGGDGGEAAFRNLLTGGAGGLDALLGGGRNPDGTFGRLEAHGFYWTATEVDAGTAVFYNFGKGQLKLHRQGEGEKARAFSVRCVLSQGHTQTAGRKPGR